ncbi:MAG: hypothetical protein M0024_00950 [Nitrospiraceae bacterium]|nr:hypothetical protein [Nitrospiraceae bacterium]
MTIHQRNLALDDRKSSLSLYGPLYRGTPPEILAQLERSKIAGEYVIVVEGRSEEEGISFEEALAEVRTLLKKGLSRKDASKRIAEEYGLSRKELYDRSLA